IERTAGVRSCGFQAVAHLLRHAQAGVASVFILGHVHGLLFVRSGGENRADESMSKCCKRQIVTLRKLLRCNRRITNADAASALSPAPTHPLAPRPHAARCVRT